MEKSLSERFQEAYEIEENFYEFELIGNEIFESWKSNNLINLELVKKYNQLLSYLIEKEVDLKLCKKQFFINS